MWAADSVPTNRGPALCPESSTLRKLKGALCRASANLQLLAYIWISSVCKDAVLTVHPSALCLWGTPLEPSWPVSLCPGQDSPGAG